MKRVLLSLMVIGAIFYPAYTYFAANDQPKSGGRSAILRQVPAPASPGVEGIDKAQAAEEPGGTDAMAPVAPNSPHAITVDQAPPQATAETPSQAPVHAPAQAQAPVFSPPPQATAEAPAQAPAQAQAPASLPPAPEATQPPPAASAEASPDATPDQPAFMKVTSPTSIREGPSVSSAIIGIGPSGRRGSGPLARFGLGADHRPRLEENRMDQPELPGAAGRAVIAAGFQGRGRSSSRRARPVREQRRFRRSARLC